MYIINVGILYMQSSRKKNIKRVTDAIGGNQTPFTGNLHCGRHLSAVKNVDICLREDIKLSLTDQRKACKVDCEI